MLVVDRHFAAGGSSKLVVATTRRSSFLVELARRGDAARPRPTTAHFRHKVGFCRLLSAFASRGRFIRRRRPHAAGRAPRLAQWGALHMSKQQRPPRV
jgi:hypothetical protein